MNLIDRDKVLKLIPSEEIGSRIAVANAPVVDAVPVSWILDQWISNYYDMPESSKIVIRTMIGNWREENANHD